MTQIHQITQMSSVQFSPLKKYFYLVNEDFSSSLDCLIYNYYCTIFNLFKGMIILLYKKVTLKFIIEFHQLSYSSEVS